MRRRRLRLVLAATGAAAMVFMSAPSAFATGHDERKRGRGATVEEFICFRDTDDEVTLGTGRVISTPSGNVHVICTGEPF